MSVLTILLVMLDLTEHSNRTDQFIDLTISIVLNATQNQTGLGWKEPLEVKWSNPCIQAVTSTAH